MLTLNDGRSELWQWDTGRALAVDADCSQVHFSNKVFGRSIDVDVVGGTAIIPDVLLQTEKDLNVWAFVGTAENGYTKISKTFKVNRRNKPADYVFTPVEQTTIEEIAAIAQSVRDDADAGLFDGKQGENGRDGVNGKDGAPGKDGTSATHSWNGTVLTITSASGTSSADLKGDKGDKGEQGIPGPAGSVDNLTAESIQSALGYTPANSADLADKLPKSPTGWEPWTAEEQAAARDRMGLDNTCELIETWTNETKEPVDFVRTQTPDGTPYAYKHMLIRMLGETKQENWKTIVCYLDEYSKKNSFYFYAKPVNNWDTYISIEDGFAVMENNPISKEGNAPHTEIAYYDTGIGRRKTIQPKAFKKIAGIKISWIPAGSTLYIWGAK